MVSRRRDARELRSRIFIGDKMQKNQSGGTNFLYHPELIALYNSGVPAGILVGNTLIGIVFFYLLYPFIPITILMAWTAFNLSVSLFRFLLSRRFSGYKSDTKRANRYVNMITFSTSLNGIVWGLASILAYHYAPSSHLSLSVIIIIGIIAGAMSTLSPIFRAYIAYTIFAILPMTVVLYLSDKPIHNATALLSLFLTLFIIVGGYKHFKKLRETIILKDKLKLLNDDLEGEVKKRTLELEVLNNSLEDKVQEEIAKNRTKDQQLVQQSRMAQMGEMISMIAHQWRQPLGAIAASSIDLKMQIAFGNFDLDKKEEQAACSSYFDEQLTHIEEYVQSLTTTIDDFRNFYKPNKDRKIININDPIKKSLSIIEASAKAHGIEITLALESQKEYALFDSELMQVFLNIIKNAQDNFVEKEIADARIMIETKDTDNGVLVEICDNGGGIPEDIKAKIFDPYFSTKDEKNGTGLGLYMSKTIIEEHHDGELGVKNSDKGVCFTIIIRGEDNG